MKDKTKNYLFIDGTNLFAGQYELFGPKKYLDFSRLIEELQKKIKTKFDKIYFYASYSPKPEKPTKRQKLYLKNEALFYRNVRKTKNVVFFKGYRSKTSGKEKGIDVKLAADLVSFAFLNKYDVIYLFSGDADFLPALFVIKKFCRQKAIYLLCMENKLMYQGIFYFKTFAIIFRKKLMFKRKLRNLINLCIRKEELIIET